MTGNSSELRVARAPLYHRSPPQVTGPATELGLASIPTGSILFIPIETIIHLVCRGRKCHYQPLPQAKQRSSLTQPTDPRLEARLLSTEPQPRGLLVPLPLQGWSVLGYALGAGAQNLQGGKQFVARSGLKSGPTSTTAECRPHFHHCCEQSPLPSLTPHEVWGL